jgi:hypothetical protein
MTLNECSFIIFSAKNQHINHDLGGDGKISRLHSFLLYQYLSSKSLTFISTSSLYLKQLCTVDGVYYSMTKSYDSTIRLSCIKRRLECQCGTINSFGTYHLLTKLQ